MAHYHVACALLKSFAHPQTRTRPCGNVTCCPRSQQATEPERREASDDAHQTPKARTRPSGPDTAEHKAACRHRSRQATGGEGGVGKRRCFPTTQTPARAERTGSDDATRPTQGREENRKLGKRRCSPASLKLPLFQSLLQKRKKVRWQAYGLERPWAIGSAARKSIHRASCTSRPALLRLAPWSAKDWTTRPCGRAAFSTRSLQATKGGGE